MFSPASQKNEKIIAVADIGSGSVGVAILSVTGGPARVLIAERDFLGAEERGADAAVSGIVTLLSQTAQKALAAYTTKAGPQTRPVSRLYGVINVPWTRSRTIHARALYQKGTKIEREMIETLTREAFAADKESEKGNILEASVIRVELNGYPTAKPVGKRAHILGVGMLLSECDPKIRQGVIETMTRTFSLTPNLRSGTGAVLSVLRQSSALPKECLIVTVGGEATNLLAIRKGVAAESAVVPEGARSLLQRIGGKTMPEEALSLMRMAASGRSDTDAARGLEERMAKAEPELVKIFAQAIGNMAALRRLPNTLVLVVREEFGEWLTQFFSRIDFSPFTMTTQPFSPALLGHKDFSGIIKHEEGAIPDAELCVAAAFAALEEQST